MAFACIGLVLICVVGMVIYLLGAIALGSIIELVADFFEWLEDRHPAIYAVLAMTASTLVAVGFVAMIVSIVVKNI